jgi:UDP-2-acetamido-3-amino-2,3-dideoxy-glucuronate N-acetyltransferase
MSKYYVHPQGICESRNVGENTRVWAFAHVLPGAEIGSDCNICDHVFVENEVVIGDNVTIKSGVQVWDGITLADDVFVGPNVTFTNDPMPRSKVFPVEFAKTTVAKGASLGGGSVILPGVRVGRSAMVGAGAVVTKDVPPNAIVVGNPARIVGYVNTTAAPTTITELGGSAVGELTQIDVPGVELRQIRRVVDLRGSLVAADFFDDLPFVPRRAFAVSDVPTKDVRGEHAHHKCKQFLLCLAGSVSCVVDTGEMRQEFRLDRPDMGLYIPPMTWASQYNYSSDSLLLVFASHQYDASDYIRDYDEYLSLASKSAAISGGGLAIPTQSSRK